jgi:hypothetical protein
MLSHGLSVLIAPEHIAVVALEDPPIRRVQAAIMRDQHAPAALAVIDALREVGRRRDARPH